MIYKDLKITDPDIYELVRREQVRQRDGVELIASENYVSRAVLEALGTVFTNKYAEGYPGRRYYGGQVNTDQLEQLAIDRAKALFRSDHANVQPLSGAAANIATYFAYLKPGDTVLGMDLSHGGHLTHGAPVTYMAKLFNFVRYGMSDNETGGIDFNQLRALAKKTRPKIILAGFSAYPRELDYSAFAAIAKEVDAIAMADMAHIAGLIAAGVLKNPLDAGFQIMTTTTHKTLRGPRGAMILSQGLAGNPLKVPDKKIENLPTLIDRSVFPGFQGGPHMNSIAAIAVALGEAATPEYQIYARQVVLNAARMAERLMAQGVKLVTNGTDNHLLVIDCVRSWNLTGNEVEKLFDLVGITASKSTIPDDSNPPYRPSGLRLGTPAMTTRGMKEAEIDTLVNFMLATIANRSDSDQLDKLHDQVTDFCRQYPVPGVTE